MMENKRIIYGLVFTIIIIVIVAATQIDYLTKQVHTLEEDLTQMETKIEEKNTLLDSLTDQVASLNADITNLEMQLVSSHNNNTQLKTQISEMNNTLMLLQSDIMTLEDSVNIIGRGEISLVLEKYGETVAMLDDLEKEYADLLVKYNELLEQIED